MEKLTGQGCPSNQLQGVVGQFYENTNTGDIYECRSITKDGNDVLYYTWELRANGDHIDDHAEIFGGSSKYTQPDWGSETGIVDIYSEAQIVVNTDGYYIAERYTQYPTIGGTVTVTIDGAEYDCIVYDLSILNDNPSGVACLFGNLSAYGLECGNSDAPFVMMILKDGEDNVYGSVIPTSEDFSIPDTISVRGKSEVIHKIPSEYVEGSASGGGTFVVCITWENGEPKADKTFEETCEAAKTQRVVLITNDDGFIEQYDLLSADSNYEIQFAKSNFVPAHHESDMLHPTSVSFGDFNFCHWAYDGVIKFYWNIDV